MRTEYYIAYGSNLNVSEMGWRCPTAEPVGSAMLDGWQLVFNGVATIVPVEGASTPVGVWKIDEASELALDRYESFPNYYRKEYITLNVNGKELTAMVYIMNGGRPALPSGAYLAAIRDGYGHFDLEVSCLEHALKYTSQLLCAV